MLNKFIAQILSLTLFLYSPAFAQDTEDPKFTRLERGGYAPFAGTLFNPAATAEIITRHQYSLMECDLRVEYEVAQAQATMQLQLDSLQISYDALSERHTLLMDIKNNEIDTYRQMALKQPNDNSNLWLAGGVVVGIGLSLGTLYAVTNISE